MQESNCRGHVISTYLSDFCANEIELGHDIVGFDNFFTFIINFFLSMWSSLGSSLLFFLNNLSNVSMVAKINIFDLN